MRRRHRHGAPALHADPGLHGRRERRARATSAPRGSASWTGRTARREVQEVSERYGLQVPVDALVQDLPVGVQQRVEIVKALIRDAKVLILDEPTAVLTPQETDDLMEVMRSLKDGGHLDRLHHPQAARGPRRRRPDHRDPPRQGGRRGQPDVVRGRAGLDDGRPPGEARTSRRSPRDAGRRGDLASRTSGSSTTPARCSSTASASRCGPARSTPSPASRATARPS